MFVLGKNSPIGVFDSGVGGLTVVKALLEELPEENFIYFGDTANVPYGNKSKQQLFEYAHNIINFLINRGVKAIVVACGTHSSVTLPDIADQYSIPLLGVVKAGSRSATKITNNGRIGIAATSATVNSRAYTREIQQTNPDYQVFETACPHFVPLVESGNLDGKEVRNAVQEYLDPLMDHGIDTLVLGCTHYPFLTPVIKEFVGKDVNLIDPSYETINDLKGILARQQLYAVGNEEPLREFYVSGNDDSFYKVGNLLIGNAIRKVNKIVLD
ncbi:MAG: glutamate racemase [Syntrophomonadaceae bacterium]|nr:glutamate racemase [Syntrophomonadaceae bacterium]MDD3889823.1 glutamate racemase [Syntrophomonadaceae bacterium]